jgi:Immunoglobulin I-set domain
VRWRGRQVVVSGGIVPHVFELSRPEYPLKLGGYVSPVDSVGMALLDDLVLDGGVPALGRPQHFNVFDIGSLPHVFPVGRLQMGGPVEDIVVHRGHIFVAATRAGVDVLTMEPNGPPVVVRPLGPLRVAAGSNVELQARVSGGRLRYQWLKAGEPISGATNRVLRLPNVGEEQMGDYSVVASNRLGSVSGGLATLTLADGMPLRIVHGTGTIGAAARPQLFGPPGFHGYLLASTNLLDWQPIWFVELGVTPPGVSDPISPLPAARYYRLEPGVE